jgi:hypothetical protein
VQEHSARPAFWLGLEARQGGCVNAPIIGGAINPNFGDDWATPDSEDAITDWLRRQLKSRLTIATTIDREVHVERETRGMGTLWVPITLSVRHEALFDRTGVKGPRRLDVAASGLKLEEA